MRTTGMLFGIAAALLAAAPPASPAAPLERTPAYELLEALDLLPGSAGLPEGKAPAAVRPDGSFAVRLHVPEAPPKGPFAARGRQILQLELANINSMSLHDFDLLYGADGRLLAVFPVFPPKQDGSARSAKDWEDAVPAYLDISPFYIAVPAPDAPGASARWSEFSAALFSDRRAIEKYAREKYPGIIDLYPGFLRHRWGYRLHSVDAVTGGWDAHDFDPLIFSKEHGEDEMYADMPRDEFLSVFSDTSTGAHRAVLPAFPTVYELTTFSPDELAYQREVYSRYGLPKDAEILVVGPGTGVDAWVASFRTSRPVDVIGINPLEVANTRASAKAAGFKVNAVVGDNVADGEGRLRLPGRKFDAVFWNMPSVTERTYPEGHFPSMMDFWDMDVGGSILARFAKALPDLLKQGGRALLWNYAVYSGDRNMVAEELANAGGEKKVMEVETERFLKRDRAEKEWFKGHLYSVTLSSGPAR